MRIPSSIYGVLARLINLLTPTKKNVWAFGADCGKTYRESSKYMLEYMINNHSQYECFFITKNKKLCHDLNSKGITCYYNYSIKGIFKIAQASCLFTTQVAGDIDLIYKKRNRRFFYFGHGMPYKKAFCAVSDDWYKKRNAENSTFIKSLWHPIAMFLTNDYSFKDSEFAISTSDFLVPYVKMYYGKNMPVKVIGFPRNDIFFNDKKMRGEKWIENSEGKFIVTYMPTHRDLGKGELTPYPFENRPDIQQWLEDNKVLFVMKQHPNMIPKLKAIKTTSTFVDITNMFLDPQCCLYHSDILITDYSSVWLDYLILQRPLFFYYYDNYEEKDWGTLYDIRKDSPGHISSSPDELFALIKRAKENYKSMCPTDEILNKYHKYFDGNSCERYFKEIILGVNS